MDVTEEIIFTGSNPTVDRQTRRLAASGKLRKVHSSIYTSNLTESLEHIGLRHALEMAGHLFPGAVLSGRTAKEMHAARVMKQDGSRTGSGFVFLCHVKARRSVALPGVEIKARHSDLMSGRPENAPGQYKQRPTAAGNTLFVSPGRVRGTLHARLAIVNGMEHPFGRAVLMHFLLADVHPFVDGNGRISRIMMTKELLASGLSRITIPTVWREDYLGALRALNRYDDPGPIIRAFAFAQRVTAACVAKTVDEAISLWASCCAFVEAGAHARLTLPQAAAKIVWRDSVPAPADYWTLVESGGASGFAEIAQRN